MEKASKNAGAAATAAMTPRASRHNNNKNQETSNYTENFNPNVFSQQTPGSSKPYSSKKSCASSTTSPVVGKSCSAKKSHKPKNPNSPKNKIRQRKFVVAKKKQKNDEKEGDEVGSTVSFCNCKEKKGGSGGNAGKCLCVAYQNLRKSHEEFFKNRCVDDDDDDDDEEEGEAAETDETKSVLQQEEGKGLVGNGLIVKRSRERLMEEARESVAQIGSGKVMNLVKAFEKLLSEPKSKDEDQKEEEEKEHLESNKVMKWPLPKLNASETGVYGSSFCPQNLILTSQNLGLDPPASVSSSWDSSRGSVSTRTSNGGRRSRRNSLESSSTIGGGRRWRKKQQQKVTNQKPFKLRTEQRGKLKEEEFVKKIQEIMTEEEKQRIPIAQGLPWTTDEPECLVKPPVKEITIPVDLKLHTDVRALDRAEFDQQMAEKLSFIEQYKMERERQQKLAEEEEIKRLRKELVPKAQPMPYFDRPFIPRRSMKNPTMPREPKFHKKIKCSLQSWNDMNPYSSSSCLN